MRSLLWASEPIGAPGSETRHKRRRGGLPAVLLAAVLVLGSCGDDRTSASDQSSTSLASTTAPRQTTTSAVAEPPTTPPTEPATVTVTSEAVAGVPLAMPPALLAAVEGMVIAGEMLQSSEDEGLGRSWLAIVRDGVAIEIVAGQCYRDSWHLGPPLDASGGAMLLQTGEGLVVCAPGEQVRLFSGRVGVQGTTVIDGRALALVGAEDGLHYLDLETMAVEPFADLQFDVSLGNEWPTDAKHASHGTGTWAVVLESTAGPMQDRVRRLVFFDDTGGPLDIDAPFAEPADDSKLAAAALSSDGTTLFYAEEYPDGATDLVRWDLAAKTEIGRVRILDAFERGDDPYGFGRPFVSYLDVGPEFTLVGLATVEAENFLSGVLLVGSDGSIEDLSESGDWRVVAASFLD